MQVIGTIETQDEPVAFQVRRYDRMGRLAGVRQDVQEEALLSVYVNDILTMQLGCSANHLVELVLGRLFTEGLISAVDEIDAISICEHSMRADVALGNRAADLSAQAVAPIPTCCTNNRALNTYFVRSEDVKPVVPIAWTTDQVFAMMDAFAQDRTAHSRTRGTHSAYLWRFGELLCCREDIGRHNAFDKAIGHALIEGIDLRKCGLFTSGRVPTDMVTKAIRARLPLLVSKAVATDKTVALSREYDLTLICDARDGAIEVFNDPCVAEFATNRAC